MIEKAIIPAAGLGTRLLPATKEQPKEMLPIFSRTQNSVLVKPVLQVIYETIHRAGVRNFYFITGRTKRAIEDHFTIDPYFIAGINHNKHADILMDFQQFYEMLENSRTFWIKQPSPRGFGDAVYQAKDFVGTGSFLVHAGDTLVKSECGYLQKLFSVHETNNADVTFLVERTKTPERYGIIEAVPVADGVHMVTRIIEKPAQPPTNLAVVAIYVFNSKIFSALEKISPDKNNEKQLTDAIEHIIQHGGKVLAVELNENEKRIDIGTPESYRDAVLDVM
ncbi:MAG: sugar phosphate nucleotidyltransferase [Candidatus Aenigmatarchaeota archaeon]